MKFPRSPMFYFFTIPFTSCAAVGMYSIYDSPTGQFVKTQGVKCLNHMSSAFANTYTSIPYGWPFNSAQLPPKSDEPKKPPPMPY